MPFIMQNSLAYSYAICVRYNFNLHSILIAHKIGLFMDNGKALYKIYLMHVFVLKVLNTSLLSIIKFFTVTVSGVHMAFLCKKMLDKGVKNGRFNSHNHDIQ